MKKITLTFVFVSLSFSVIPQNGMMYQYTKGQTIKYESTTYPMMMEKDPSILTAGDKEKVKKAEAFKLDIASGKIQPKSTSTITMRVLEVNQNGARTEYHMKSEGLPNNITLTTRCTKDSAVQVINDGRGASVKNNDTIAIAIYGTSYFPTEMKVGSRLRGYSTLALFSPEGQTKDLKKMFYRPYDPFTTSPGAFNEACSNINPFKPSINVITLVQPPLVLKEEKVTVAGKEYTAYVIGTESWTKDLRSSKESAYEIELKYLQSPDMSKNVFKTPSHEAGGKRVWKKQSGAIMDVNEQGFPVSYKEEWYVPGFGVVKTAFYDTNGALFSVSQLKSIE